MPQIGAWFNKWWDTDKTQSSLIMNYDFAEAYFKARKILIYF